MEAMSVESLLLSAWEEDGYVGKARVPVGPSDVDVLAVHAGRGSVRVGEAKVRDGSQTVYVVDESSMAFIAESPEQDFAAWMEEAWSGWLANLPRLWGEDGEPAVPWLPRLPEVREIQVVFSCNLFVFCGRAGPDEALARAALRSLRENPAVATRIDAGLRVTAAVKATGEVAADLARAVSARIESGYGRRFGDLFKDLFRELHRYMAPALTRLPADAEGRTLGARKAPFAERVRRATALGLLAAMGVGEGELRGWLADDPGDGEDEGRTSP